jgi:hypothetical protein
MLNATEAQAAVGYINLYMVGTAEAVEMVQRRCPEGWLATRGDWEPDASTATPVGYVRVGQVKVRHGDPAYPLYIYPMANA